MEMQDIPCRQIHTCARAEVVARHPVCIDIRLVVDYDAVRAKVLERGRKKRRDC